MLEGLIARHSERLGHILSEDIDPTGVTNEVMEQTKLFIEFSPSRLESNNKPVHVKWNCDETRLKLDDHHSNLKLIESNLKQAHRHLAPIKGKVWSCATVMNPLGGILFSLYVLPLKSKGSSNPHEN